MLQSQSGGPRSGATDSRKRKLGEAEGKIEAAGRSDSINERGRARPDRRQSKKWEWANRDTTGKPFVPRRPVLGLWRRLLSSLDVIMSVCTEPAIQKMYLSSNIYVRVTLPRSFSPPLTPLSPSHSHSLPAMLSDA